MAENEFIVTPRSRKELREIAARVREVFGCTAPKIDIVRIVELELQKLEPEFVFHTPYAAEMGDIHGLTNPVEKWMYIREDVYNGALKDKGRDRMTMAHELGHYLLHRRVDFPFVPPGSSVPPYRRSEWQANTFGAELLICAAHLDGCTCVEDLVERFCVSYEGARLRILAFAAEAPQRSRTA